MSSSDHTNSANPSTFQISSTVWMILAYFSSYFILFNFIPYLPLFFRGMISAYYFFILPGYFFDWIRQYFSTDNGIVAESSGLSSIIVGSLIYWVFFSTFFMISSLSLNFHHVILYQGVALTITVLIIELLLIFNPDRRLFKVYSLPRSDRLMPMNRKSVSYFLQTNLNMILLGLFVIMVSLFSVLRIDTLPTDDVWYHLTKLDEIFALGYIKTPVEYNGKFVYHYVNAIFCLLSGIDPYSYARFITLWQYPLGIAVFFQFLDNILPDQNLRILTTVLFSLTAFGTILNFSQLWPTAFVMLFMIALFNKVFQYLALRDKVGEIRLRFRFVFYLDFLVFGCVLSLLHYISQLLISIILIVIFGFFWIRNRQYWVEFLLFSLFIPLHLLFNPSLIPFLVNNYLQGIFRWWMVLALVPLILILIPFERFFHSNTYNLSKKNREFIDPANSTVKIERKYLWKYIIPVAMVISLIIFYLWFYISNPNLRFSVILSFFNAEIEGLLIVFIVISLLLYREYSIHGKFQYLYGAMLLFFIIGGIILSIPFSFTNRIINLSLPILFANVGLYFLYIERKMPKISHLYRKVMLFFLIALTINIPYHLSYSDAVTTSEYTSIGKQVQFLTNHNSFDNRSSLIVGTFHWAYLTNNLADNNSVTFDPFFSYVLTDEFLANSTNFEAELSRIAQDYHYQGVFLFVSEYDVQHGILLNSGTYYGDFTHNTMLEMINSPSLNRISVSSKQRSLFYFIGV